MSDLNLVVLHGTVVRDAVLKSASNSNIEYVSFTIACNRTRKTEDGFENIPTYVNLSIFGKYAKEKLAKLQVGRMVEVEGSLKFDSWTDKEGKKQSRLGVAVKQLHIIPYKTDKQEKSPKFEPIIEEDYSDDIPAEDICVDTDFDFSE